MPIQDGGRIKPFSTWAGFTMLKLHGDRNMTIIVDDKKVKLGPEEVLLDCLFRPELARKLPVFRIDDNKIIKSLSMDDLGSEERRITGIHSDQQLEEIIKKAVKGKDRRDRYSYEELEPISMVLYARLRNIMKKQPDKSKMTADQRHTVDLSRTIQLFSYLIYHMDFVRADIEIREGTPAMDREADAAHELLGQVIPGTYPGGAGDAAGW